MDTTIEFLVVLLGHVPFFGTAVALTALFFGATKLFPKFGAKVDRGFDALFGVSEEYDEIHETGFRIHPANYMKAPSR